MTGLLMYLFKRITDNVSTSNTNNYAVPVEMLEISSFMFLDLINKFKCTDYFVGDVYEFTQSTDADMQTIQELFLDATKYDHGGVTSHVQRLVGQR